MDGRIVALGIRDLKFRHAAVAGWLVDVPALDLRRSEQMLLTGDAGSGKSTLLHLIAGLIDPERGRVFVAGADVHALRGARRDLHRARAMGVLFSTPNLLAGFSAVENVMAALMFAEIPRGQHRARAERLLKQIGIENTDADPETLSPAQRQRIALARAVVCDPALVLADEPVECLDGEDAEVTMDLLQSICREKNAALLCVSRDRSMNERFDRFAPLSELAALEGAGREGP